MAVTLKRAKYFALGNIVKARSVEFSSQREKIRSLAEADFQSKVVNEGLSYASQAAYRDEQIRRENLKEVPDQEYIKSLEGEKAKLGKLDRAQRFNDAYFQSYTDLVAGRRLITDHLDFLKDQLSSAMDTDLQDAIKTKVAEAESKNFEYQNSIVENRAKYAMDSQSSSLISSSIQEAETKRGTALATGDQEQVTRWDATLLTLRSALESQKIQDTFHDFEVESMKKPADAMGVLDFYTEKMNAASESGVILKVGENTYKSAKEFWQAKTNDFVNNKFFDTLGKEMSAAITKSGKEMLPVTQNEIESINKQIDALMHRPDMAVYAKQIGELKTNLNYQAGEVLGEKIYNDYVAGKLGKTTMENYNNAVLNIENLSKKYNIDLQKYSAPITADFGKKKEQAASAMLETTAQYMRPADKGGLGLTADEALKQAEKDVPAIDVPAIDLAEKKPIDIAREAVKQTQGAGSKYSIKDAAKPQDTAPTSQAPKLGAQLPVPELVSLYGKNDIYKDQTGKIFLREGVQQKWQKINNPNELSKYNEQQLIRPANSKDIYAKL